MADQPRSPSPEGPARVVAALGMAVAACLCPWLFRPLFAMGPLRAEAQAGLWIGAGLVAGGAWLLRRRSARVRPAWVAIALGLVALAAVELGVRLGINVLARSWRPRLAWLADRTHPEFLQIRGHPFLHYTGNHNPGGGRFNNYGFSGPDFQAEKTPGTVRVVCLGGSTTESLWPFQMQDMLNEAARREDRPTRFEVLNFGKIGYTSLHDLVTFAVDAIEFAPDYVVVHSGWNDTVARNWPHPVRWDYADILRPFAMPTIPDKWPVRLSVVYRLALLARGREPWWADIRNTLETESRAPRTFADPERELLPFRHNVEKIVAFARLRNVRVVLAPIPHSIREDVPSAEDARHLDQCAAILREIAAADPQGVMLVDLDRELTGRDALFLDLAHMGPEGDAEKAALIGKAIFADARRESR